MRLAKGYWGGRSRLFKTAKEAVMKALASSYRDRRRKKGEFRRLWIARISAAVRAEGITYSQFMHGLIEAGVVVNRKALSNMAIEDPVAFKAIVTRSKESLAGIAATTATDPTANRGGGGIHSSGVPAAGVGAK